MHAKVVFDDDKENEGVNPPFTPYKTPLKGGAPSGGLFKTPLGPKTPGGGQTPAKTPFGGLRK
eukprot:3997906-Pyramimonas_sp.AAC.1